MDYYPIKVRIEVGPGAPSELAPMDTTDAHRALLKAFTKMLTMGQIPAGHEVSASHGLATVRLILTKFRSGSEPHHDSLTTHYSDYELAASLEQWEPGNN